MSKKRKVGLGDQRVNKKTKEKSPSFFCIRPKIDALNQQYKATMSNLPIFLHTIWFNFFRCLPHPEVWYVSRSAKVAPEPPKISIKIPRRGRYAPDKT